MSTPECTSRDRRAAMSDEEFWTDVAESITDVPEPEPEPDPVEISSLSTDPCPVCGEVAGCGTDFEGRILIHPLDREDE